MELYVIKYLCYGDGHCVEEMVIFVLSVGAGVIFQLHFIDVPSCKEWVSTVAIQHVSILPLISDLNGVLLHTAR